MRDLPGCGPEVWGERYGAQAHGAPARQGWGPSHSAANVEVHAMSAQPPLERKRKQSDAAPPLGSGVPPVFQFTYAPAAGYAIANANWTRRFGPVQVALGIGNLFDRAYDDPGSVPEVMPVVSQDGRVWHLSFDVAF